MNGADLTITIIILVSMLMGLAEGFTRTVLSSSAWVLSLGITLNFVDVLVYSLMQWIPFADLRIGMSFIVLFIVTLMITLWSSYLIVRSIGYIKLSVADRIFSLLFGLMRGCVLIIFLVILANLSKLPTLDWWQHSQFITYFQPVVVLLCTQLPTDIAAQFNFNMVPIKGSPSH